MEEKKRKSSRSFDLEKGSKRSFDLSKTSARKFDFAKDSDEVSLEELKKELLADGTIDAEEVAKLREVLYADGQIDQEEADFIFELNDAVSGNANAPAWNQFFVQAISDYLLNDEKSPGVIDDEEGKWLVKKIGADGKVDGIEKQLLDHLKKNAKKIPAAVTALMAGTNVANAAPSGKTSLEQLKKELLADGTIDAEEVAKLREVLYADGQIDQEEADFLFELNDAVSGNANAPAWNQFFVQAISDYLLNDKKSPGVIDEEEGKWLIEKIGSDGQVDGVEKQLLSHLKKNAKKMPIAVSALITGQGGVHQEKPVQEEPEHQSSGNGKKWLVAALVVAALAGGGYYLLNKDNQNSNTENVPAQQIALNENGKDSEGSPASVKEDNEYAVKENEAGDVDAAKDGSEDQSQGVEESDVAENRAEPQKSANAGSGKVAENQKQDAVKNNPASQSAVQNQTAANQSSRQSLASTLEEQAYQVIRGEFGNNPERAQRLGDAYRQIQDKVNELYRNGLVN